MGTILDKVAYLIFGSRENDISNLLDKNLDYVHRDAAAESLLKREYGPDTVAAYLEVACDAQESRELVEECGEDLGIVWTGLDQCPSVEDFARLRPEARAYAYHIIQSRKPEWLPKLLWPWKKDGRYHID